MPIYNRSKLRELSKLQFRPKILGFSKILSTTISSTAVYDTNVLKKNIDIFKRFLKMWHYC